ANKNPRQHTQKKTPGLDTKEPAPPKNSPASSPPRSTIGTRSFRRSAFSRHSRAPRSRQKSSWRLGSPPVAVLRQASRIVPIVFVLVADPVGAGFVESLARPGGNATGFTRFAPWAPNGGRC